MANPYLKAPSNPYLPSTSQEAKKQSLLGRVVGGPTGFVGNLVGDVKDAVVGLPAGIVMSVKDPVGAGKLVGTQMWQTWSPLFKGHPGEFAANFYDHPLAPILDVATVFTLGAGGAARGAGALSKAGVGGARTQRVAGLRAPKELTLPDPTGKGRHAVYKPLSQRAGRRLVQEGIMSLEAHLPKWGGQGKKLGDALARSRYESRFLIDMSHRAAAKNLMLTTMLKAGQTLSDSNPEAPRIRTELLANAHLNLMFHNRDLALTPAEAKAAKIGSRGSGYRFIEAPGSGDQIQARAMTRLHKQEQRLKRQLDKSDAARRTAIENEIADVRSQIEDRQRYAYAQKYSSRSGSAAEFEKAANDLGNLALTRDVNKAARTADGKLYVVPKHDAKAFGAEMASSSRFARIVWDKPTYLWKMAMIGYTPRSIVNNAVGNWAMYALREGGGVDGVKALYDAVRLTHGDKVALESMKSAMPFKRNNWLYQNFGNELGNVFGHELLTAGARSKSALKKRLSEGLYPLVHQIADEPVRVASISKYLRGDAEVKRLMKGGLSFDDAAARALRNDSSLQRRASEHARAVAGDYFTLRGWEKTVRKLVPFYLWDRHIVRTTGNMFADTPGRLAIMQQLSNAGIEETERILGDIPDFLKGAIPLEMLGLDSEEGRNSVLTTASLNPWATIGEIVNLGQALTIGGGRTSDAMLGAHPFITGGIEFVTGRSVLSGAPKATDGGLVFSVAKNSIMGFPGIQLADELISEDTDTTSKGNPLLFSRDDKSAVSRFLGIPIREVDSETAARMKAAQNAGKAPAKKNPYGGG